MTASHRPDLRRRATIGFGLAVAVCTLDRPAHAAPAAAIPAECGSLSEFEAELQSRVGPDTSIAGTRVTLTPDVSGYRLVVEAGGERRELEDANCHELMHAAVVIALALLEPRSARPDAPREEPLLLTPPRAPELAGRRAFRVAIAAAAGVHFGTVPDPTLLLDLDTQLKWTRWGIAGGFRYLLPASDHDATNHGARVSGIGAYLAGSFEPWSRVQGRLGFVGYRLSGSGLGSVERSADTAWELGPTVGASFTPFQRAPFWTNVAAEGQLNLLRPRFDIHAYGPVFRVPWVSGSFFLRVGVVF